MRLCDLGSKGLFVFSLIAVFLASSADAASVTWIGGDADWVDGVGNNANWSPVDEPDTDDTAIFNTSNGVNLGSNNSILALTMSGGIDLSTNDFDLDVNGTVQLSGSSTYLIVGGSASTLSADGVTINNGGHLSLTGGTVNVVEESGDGFLDIIAGGELLGYGTVNMNDAVAAGTTLIVNGGTITARHAPTTIFGTPPVDTLSFNASDGDTRIDLDGNSEAGTVNVTHNQTLDINIALSDSFSGTMNLAQDATLDMAFGWVLNSGVINADNGASGGIPATPKGVSTIAGANFTQIGGTINVVDGDGTLRFNSNFTMNSGTLNNNGLVIFDGDATIAAGANFNMGASTSSLTVEANRTVQIQQTNFNLDGTIIGTSIITVNSGGTLNITSNDYDSDSVVNAFNGVINLNSGTMTTNTGDAEFVMDGVLNMSNTTGVVPVWSGEPLDIGNDSGVLNADLNIIGPGVHNFSTSVDFNSDADVDIPAGSTLQFTSSTTVNFDTVNAGNNAEFTGGGAMVFNGGVNVNEAVTLNLVGGSVDLDGTDAVGDFINIDAPMTINAATLSSFGKTNLGGGTNTLDVNNSAGTGVLTVNLDDANAKWTLNGPGVMNLVNDNTAATLLAGNDVNLNGTVNVVGDVRVTARVDIAGTVNINTVNEPLRLAGGSASFRNTIAGGTINGSGLLSADPGRGLEGHGTVNTNIDFDGSSGIYASGGTLNIAGSIVDVGSVVTFTGGVMNIVNSWNSNVAEQIRMFGGELAGGTITLDGSNGITGYGLVSARVINNTRLRAEDNLETLVLQTTGNDNDWDGAANTGMLQSVGSGGTLELRDNSTFGFGGTVQVENNSRVFTNGFGFTFNPGSALNLTHGTYESTSSTDLGGTVTVVAGGESRIKVANNFFLTFESGSATTLNANLRLENNNINVEAGATFSGGGALVIPDGSHLVADNLANIGVLLDMQGAFRPGNFDGIGRVDLLDYQQADSGKLYTELTGTALNAFDRLVASGDVVLDGYLNIDIDGGFVPTLGQTFNIITGNTVTGQFDYYDISGMPAGLAFHVKYLLNAVQLEVVNKEFFAADFDEDGDVDQTDYAIWKGAFGLNQLGDATGDNISDAADYTVWRDQLGSVSDGIPGSGSLALAAVPEPGTATLVAVAAACLLARRRHNIDAFQIA